VVEWPTLVFGAWLLLLAGWLLLIRSLDFGRPRARFPRRAASRRWSVHFDAHATRFGAFLLAFMGTGLVITAFVRG
jgi:hypothetical protein